MKFKIIIHNRIFIFHVERRDSFIWRRDSFLAVSIIFRIDPINSEVIVFYRMVFISKKEIENQRKKFWSPTASNRFYQVSVSKYWNLENNKISFRTQKIFEKNLKIFLYLVKYFSQITIYIVQNSLFFQTVIFLINSYKVLVFEI